MGRPDESPRICRMVSVVANQGVFKLPFIEKPCGYSHFVNEIVPVPKSWAQESCNLVWFKDHKSGGHFPVCWR
jgi:hypothetical protein